MKNANIQLKDCNLCKHFSNHSYCFVYHKRFAVYNRKKECDFYVSDDLPFNEYYINEDEYNDFDDFDDL